MMLLNLPVLTTQIQAWGTHPQTTSGSCKSDHSCFCATNKKPTLPQNNQKTKTDDSVGFKIILEQMPSHLPPPNTSVYICVSSRSLTHHSTETRLPKLKREKDLWTEWITILQHSSWHLTCDSGDHTFTYVQTHVWKIFGLDDKAISFYHCRVIKVGTRSSRSGFEGVMCVFPLYPQTPATQQTI